MKKLSEYKDGEALDLLADLLEPVSLILADKEVVKRFKKNKLKGISYCIKKHQKQVIEVMAYLEGVPVKEYHCNLISLPKTVLDILNDKELMDFFGLQLQTGTEESFGSVTENTGEVAE